MGLVLSRHILRSKTYILIDHSAASVAVRTKAQIVGRGSGRKRVSFPNFEATDWHMWTARMQEPPNVLNVNVMSSLGPVELATLQRPRLQVIEDHTWKGLGGRLMVARSISARSAASSLWALLSCSC
ncbi:hypothetical protein XPA_008789 [Xanthoria parietina]